MKIVCHEMKPVSVGKQIKGAPGSVFSCLGPW